MSVPHIDLCFCNLYEKCDFWASDANQDTKLDPTAFVCTDICNASLSIYDIPPISQAPLATISEVRTLNNCMLTIHMNTTAVLFCLLMLVLPHPHWWCHLRLIRHLVPRVIQHSLWTLSSICLLAHLLSSLGWIMMSPIQLLGHLKAYTFSDVTVPAKPWTPLLLIKDAVERASGSSYNFVLIFFNCMFPLSKTWLRI